MKILNILQLFHRPLDKSPKSAIIEARMVSARNTLTQVKKPSESSKVDNEGYSYTRLASVHAQGAALSQDGKNFFHNGKFLSKGVFDTLTIPPSIVIERVGIISQRVSALFHLTLDKSKKSATIKGRTVSASNTLTKNKKPSTILNADKEGYSYPIFAYMHAQSAALLQKGKDLFHKSFLRWCSMHSPFHLQLLQSRSILYHTVSKPLFSPGFAFLLSILSIFLIAFPVAAEETLVPVGLDSTGGNYRLDTVMDIVGGTSTGAGNNFIHGFYFADEASPGAAIVNIRGVPEKRVPNLGNNQTYFLIEILPAGVPYASSQVLWSSATISAALRRTDTAGSWFGQYSVSLPLDNYDFYFTGLSDLKRRLPSYPLTDQTQLFFTADQATVLTLPATATDSALLSGDAAVYYDADGSCGASVVNCQTYSGDEWGDNYINGLDLSAIVNRLFLVDATSASILKEDLNMDGIVNGLDLSISFNNLFKYGDK